MLANKNAPPDDNWQVSTPSTHPGKRWFWYFLKYLAIPAGIIYCIAQELGVDVLAMVLR